MYSGSHLYLGCYIIIATDEIHNPFIIKINATKICVAKTLIGKYSHILL